MNPTTRRGFLGLVGAGVLAAATGCAEKRGARPGHRGRRRQAGGPGADPYAVRDPRPAARPARQRVRRPPASSPGPPRWCRRSPPSRSPAARR
ncbi:twin-arginine translocation signal domain-containing protein [Nonomuraea ferruginea]